MTHGPALRTLSSESDCGSQRLAGVAAAIAEFGKQKLIITLDLQMAPKAARCADLVTSSAVMGATGRTWAQTHDTADCESRPLISSQLCANVEWGNQLAARQTCEGTPTA